MADNEPLGVYVLYTCCPKCRGVIASQDSLVPFTVEPKDFAPFRIFITGPGATKRFPIGHGLKNGCEHSHEVAQ
jgi:hypothetical protein